MTCALIWNEDNESVRISDTDPAKTRVLGPPQAAPFTCRSTFGLRTRQERSRTGAPLSERISPW
jgi:hypothetical protein